jgi:hypothetical protein
VAARPPERPRERAAPPDVSTAPAAADLPPELATAEKAASSLLPVDEPTIRPVDEPTPAAARLGAEGLARLRARHAEVLTRITEKIPDPARREQLKTEAERLNPDTWVTDGEVVAGLEAYEAVFESLRGVIGRRRKRRRRRSAGGPDQQGGAAAAPADQAAEGADDEDSSAAEEPEGDL